MSINRLRSHEDLSGYLELLEDTNDYFESSSEYLPSISEDPTEIIQDLLSQLLSTRKKAQEMIKIGKKFYKVQEDQSKTNTQLVNEIMSLQSDVNTLANRLAAQSKEIDLKDKQFDTMSHELHETEKEYRALLSEVDQLRKDVKILRNRKQSPQAKQRKSLLKVNEDKDEEIRNLKLLVEDFKEELFRKAGEIKEVSQKMKENEEALVNERGNLEKTRTLANGFKKEVAQLQDKVDELEFELETEKNSVFHLEKELIKQKNYNENFVKEYERERRASSISQFGISNELMTFIQEENRKDREKEEKRPKSPESLDSDHELNSVTLPMYKKHAPRIETLGDWIDEEKDFVDDLHPPPLLSKQNTMFVLSSPVVNYDKKFQFPGVLENQLEIEKCECFSIQNFKKSSAKSTFDLKTVKKNKKVFTFDDDEIADNVTPIQQSSKLWDFFRDEGISIWASKNKLRLSLDFEKTSSISLKNKGVVSLEVFKNLDMVKNSGIVRESQIGLKKSLQDVEIFGFPGKLVKSRLGCCKLFGMQIERSRQEVSIQKIKGFTKNTSLSQKSYEKICINKIKKSLVISKPENSELEIKSMRQVVTLNHFKGLNIKKHPSFQMPSENFSTKILPLPKPPLTIFTSQQTTIIPDRKTILQNLKGFNKTSNLSLSSFKSSSIDISPSKPNLSILRFELGINASHQKIELQPFKGFYSKISPTSVTVSESIKILPAKKTELEIWRQGLGIKPSKQEVLIQKIAGFSSNYGKTLTVSERLITEIPPVKKSCLEICRNEFSGLNIERSWQVLSIQSLKGFNPKTSPSFESLSYEVIPLKQAIEIQTFPISTHQSKLSKHTNPVIQIQKKLQEMTLHVSTPFSIESNLHSMKIQDISITKTLQSLSIHKHSSKLPSKNPLNSESQSIEILSQPKVKLSQTSELPISIHRSVEILKISSNPIKNHVSRLETSKNNQNFSIPKLQKFFLSVSCCPESSSFIQPNKKPKNHFVFENSVEIHKTLPAVSMKSFRVSEIHKKNSITFEKTFEIESSKKPSLNISQELLLLVNPFIIRKRKQDLVFESSLEILKQSKKNTFEKFPSFELKKQLFQSKVKNFSCFPTFTRQDCLSLEFQNQLEVKKSIKTLKNLEISQQVAVSLLKSRNYLEKSPVFQITKSNFPAVSSQFSFKLYPTQKFFLSQNETDSFSIFSPIKRNLDMINSSCLSILPQLPEVKKEKFLNLSLIKKLSIHSDLSSSMFLESRKLKDLKNQSFEGLGIKAKLKILKIENEQEINIKKQVQEINIDKFSAFSAQSSLKIAKLSHQGVNGKKDRNFQIQSLDDFLVYPKLKLMPQLFISNEEGFNLIKHPQIIQPEVLKSFKIKTELDLEEISNISIIKSQKNDLEVKKQQNIFIESREKISDFCQTFEDVEKKIFQGFNIVKTLNFDRRGEFLFQKSCPQCSVLSESLFSVPAKTKKTESTQYTEELELTSFNFSFPKKNFSTVLTSTSIKPQEKNRNLTESPQKNSSISTFPVKIQENLSSINCFSFHIKTDPLLEIKSSQAISLKPSQKVSKNLELSVETTNFSIFSQVSDIFSDSSSESSSSEKNELLSLETFKIQSLSSNLLISSQNHEKIAISVRPSASSNRNLSLFTNFDEIIPQKRITELNIKTFSLFLPGNKVKSPLVLSKPVIFSISPLPKSLLTMSKVRKESIPASYSAINSSIRISSNLSLTRDPIKDFFILTCQSIKLNSLQKDKIGPIPIDSLYRKVMQEKIPFNNWYVFLKSELINRVRV